MLFQTWNEFAQINVSSITIFNISVICFKGSEEDGDISMLQLGRSKTFQSCVQILMPSFIDYVLVRS